ncbi:MAG: TetR/AcrR family transcriptional regulator [bacterium]|nr:TetR/AcrR family transcriptional regulator [bacterium]
MTAKPWKEQQKAHQRREILSAARELFMNEGHTKMSMRKLAKAVNCAPGTLYLYFKDKEHIVAHLIEESFERLMVQMENPPPSTNSLQALRHSMAIYVQFGIDNPDHYQVAFIVQRTKEMDEIRKAPHRSFAFLREQVTTCVEQEIFRPVDPELATQGLWTNLHGITSLIITMPNFPWVDKDQVLNHVIDGALAALLPDKQLDLK